MGVREFLKENILLLDGGTGTLLQSAGLQAGELPERWNITHADTVTDIHRAYFNAGSNAVCTNTFGANPLKYSENELDEIVRSAVANARRAQRESTGEQEKFIALDIGPLGKLLKPYGDLEFESAVNAFAAVVRLGVKYGVDFILIETVSDCYEMKAAILAVKENCDLPVFVSGAFGSDGKLMTGASPAVVSTIAEGLGVEAVGANCSLGPKQLAPVVEELLQGSSVPTLVKPNAGLPRTDGVKTVYDITAEEFADELVAFVKKGARIVGGCCGTTPEYIRAVRERLQGVKPLPIEKKSVSRIASYTHVVDLDSPILIGERINPTGKKRFKQALLDGEIDYALSEALAQRDNGAHALDVNVGLPNIDEEKILTEYIRRIQEIVDLPLQIDTSSVAALESALRVYNGKPLVNSVNGKEESLKTVLPLVKKYGGAVVALTLDENGIPNTAEGRVAIAEKIIRRAKAYGIEEKDILVDTLTMSVATDKNAANITLSALKTLADRGIKTVLGVSNISFGLPSRETLNAAFFARALENGLSAAIVNPASVEMQKTYRAFNALCGNDEACEDYIRFAQTLVTPVAVTKTAEITAVNEGGSALQSAIINGLKERAETLCKDALQDREPIQIVNGEIVPALDTVGKAYEEKRAYLPQLLTAAEAAKAAFEQIKAHILKTGKTASKKCKFVLATVRGDIHDIGKNIVKTLLENYGFEVIDLGKDVPAERIVEETEKTRAPLVGLSALMTTTVPAMEETVRLLKARAPWCKIVVGGAVLDEACAKRIGADKYAKDAMETVRYAEQILCKK